MRSQVFHSGPLFDLTVGGGLTAINVSSQLTSGAGGATEAERDKLIKHRVYVMRFADTIAWAAVNLYAIHRMDRQKNPSDICVLLPAVAEVSTVKYVYPDLRPYQYQWTGQSYGWVA